MAVCIRCGRMDPVTFPPGWKVFVAKDADEAGFGINRAYVYGVMEFSDTQTDGISERRRILPDSVLLFKTRHAHYVAALCDRCLLTPDQQRNLVGEDDRW